MNGPAGGEDAPTVTADQSARILPPGTRLGGRYRLDGVLGIGGMGVVYRAHDEALDVPVAVKLLRAEISARPEAFERFRQEVLLARQVSHPAVLRIHDIAREGEDWLISMELVEGEALDRRLAREGPMPVEESVRIAIEVAEGLAVAHRQGVVHRDLKPSNLLLDQDGHARIADFGIARSLRSSGLTRAGQVIGTPDYLSPEQSRGYPVDARSDLFALGVVLFEMLTGQLPFAGQTANELFTQRIAGHNIPLRRLRPDAPAWLERLIQRLLRAQPGQRLQDAESVVAALRNRRVGPDWAQWRRRLVGGGLAAALVAAAGWLGLAALPDAPLAEARRSVVLPLANAGLLDAAAARALAHRLRLQLAAGKGLAVVDSQRSDHVFERLPTPREGPPWRTEWATELPAERWLAISLHPVEGGVLAQAQWLGAGGRAQAAPQSFRAADAPSAWSGLTALLLDGAAPPLPAMSSMNALGEAIEARLRGRVENATEALDQALREGPENDSAAATLLELGLAMGDAGVATRGLAALGAPGDAWLRALAARQRGETEVAISALRTWLSDRPDDARARWQLAEALSAIGELDAAEAEVLAGLAVDEGDARGWFLRGKLAILRGDMRPAVDDYLVRAVLLAKRDRDRFAEAEAVNALGVAYARLGQMGDAEQQYRRALELRQSIGHRRGIASSLRNVAQLAMIQGRGDEAATLLEQARTLFALLEDRAGLAAIDNELGLLAEERGDYPAALAAYRAALRGREALGDRLGIAESLNNLGFAQYQLGDYDSARVYWQQALDGFATLGDRAGQIRARQNLGLLETVRGRWQRASELLEDSLREATDQQLTEERAVSLRNLAELALLQGDIARALSRIEEARKGFAEREDARGLVDLSLLEVRAQLVAGRHDAARSQLEALSADLDSASSEQQAIALLLGAELALAEGRPEDATRALERAMPHARASGVALLSRMIEALRNPFDPALAQALAQFDHRPLHWLWQQQKLRRAGDRELVDIAYAEAREELQRLPGHLASLPLHRLAAQRLLEFGDGPAAEQAERAALEARAALQSQLPATWADPPQAAER
ncbi:serine/threonine-protein kinase [Pseudomarimonas salicorniae]|uniref:Protein kinase n=1 Tax=Pseudomarimonas salicorniae TaxID=2933270 RepID=A0ABT0GJL3_9GAMM|nr:serine/threonine-protein kinase [Lysobacter sp. CAU 1642]MCK7594404.1 protein kinase [Lysobacter sp. CAU 1642]